MKYLLNKSRKDMYIFYLLNTEMSELDLYLPCVQLDEAEILLCRNELSSIIGANTPGPCRYLTAYEPFGALVNGQLQLKVATFIKESGEVKVSEIDSQQFSEMFFLYNINLNLGMY